MKKKVRIALIDSGIDNNLKPYLLGGISISINEKKDILQYNNHYEDCNGHGTFCAQVILSYNASVEFLIVKILDKNRNGYCKELIAALDYVSYFNIDIVNLSLSVFNGSKMEQIEEQCLKLWKSGTIINVSVANHFTTSFPASLRTTIGVRGAYNVQYDRIWYNELKEIQCITNMVPVLVCHNKRNRTFFGGNSKATAVLTGLLSMVISEYGIQGKEAFDFLSIRKIWKEEEIQQHLDLNILCEENNEIRDFADQVCDILKLTAEQRKSIFLKPLWPPYVNLEKYKFLDLIDELSNYYDKKIEWGKVKLTDLLSITSLYYYFSR